MLFIKKEEFRKQNSQAVVVGYDLGDEFSQISLCRLDGTDAETLSGAADAEQYNIPTVLCKKSGSLKWYYGRDALKNAEENGGILVDHLLVKARNSEKVVVEKEEFDAASLLALFVKKSFSLLPVSTSSSGIAAVMITVENLDKKMVEILNLIKGQLSLEEEQVFFQSHEDSAYHYITRQPKDLWTRETLIFDISGPFMRAKRMEMNRKTVPVAAFMKEFSYPEEKKMEDEAFVKIAEHLCKDRIISTVYLIGDGFQEEKYTKSLAFLCRGRRVFQGNNLFSKGACYTIRELAKPTALSSEYVFLGKDKLKANIGMRVVRGGEEGYLCLLNAGDNWYEAKKNMDFILEEGNIISIIITPLNESEGRVVDIALSGLPRRPDRAARIHMEVQMNSVETMQVLMQDKGFGELFPATELEWTEEIPLI